jgi:hypothetical protein
MTAAAAERFDEIPVSVPIGRSGQAYAELDYHGLMHFRLGTDEFGRLECRIGGDGEEHSVQAADAEAALADLSAALDELEATGAAGCVWLISSGE